MNRLSKYELQAQGGEVESFSPWVILVCGVDIVNSSGHKMRNPSGWYEVFSNFFIEFERILRNKDRNDGDGIQDGWNLWRVVGDELIYYRAFSVDKISNDYSHLAGISKDVYAYIHEFSESVKMWQNPLGLIFMDIHFCWMKIRPSWVKWKARLV